MDESTRVSFLFHLFLCLLCVSLSPPPLPFGPSGRLIKRCMRNTRAHSSAFRKDPVVQIFVDARGSKNRRLTVSSVQSTARHYPMLKRRSRSTPRVDGGSCECPLSHQNKKDVDKHTSMRSSTQLMGRIINREGRYI
ncbi:uncharacterized protein CLUP02_03306 [Colletotrichum lupini]|uniref:Secreted protein n=1 Tax=Colletotrichum lupini TaxID=145971 RepID=A0A9Q8SIK7_9PEZI|nr:uncharacterized protein CLUP02_03306 [Colletotrichum lupini]KAK1721873.1 hypothetical protein BDP67DRAFT_10831 [Colletotrichum lupini]UQC77835.1 hypothetical protein CLUP02_03306 [Colletotrichum lupini]